MEPITTKVAGVTFPNVNGTNRQEIISRLTVDMPCRIEAEPDNVYDPMALAVKVAIAPGIVEHIGYVPKNLAAVIAPYLDGESILVKIVNITGGFLKWDGEFATLGVVIQIDVRDRMPS